LTALGFYILVKSLSSKATPEVMGAWNWKIVIWIAGSVALYGILLPTLGFILSVIILVLISASASHEFTWKGSLLNAIFLVTFTYLVFVQGLNLQFPILPTFID
jgi:hypothetical protein